MKVIRIFIIVLFIVFTKTFAQMGFDYSGYIVNIPTFNYKTYSAHYRDESIRIKIKNFINLTRFRFRPVISLWTGARINLEYESNLIYHDSTNPLLNFDDSASIKNQIFDLSWKPVNTGNFSVKHFIDRFYFKQSFEFGNIIIGRQRIAWGTGRVWNPTDLFNPINPANFSKIEKDGADAITSKIIFGDFTDLHLVFNPDKLIRKSNYAFRFRTNYEEYDFSVIGGVINERTIAGFDFAGNLFKAGVRGEFLYSVNKANSDDDFLKFILGIDYQFTQKLYGLIEYQFNGEGKFSKEDYEMERLVNAEIINLGRHYIAVSATYEYNPLLKLSLMDNLNLNDGSGFISLSGNYSLDDDVFIVGGIQISHGHDFSEYFYFPHSFYLKMELYF